MPRRGALATQADIARALRAAKQAGDDFAVEIAPDGTIRIVPMAEKSEPGGAPRPPEARGRKDFVL